MDLEKQIINIVFGLMQECYFTIIVLEMSFRYIQHIVQVKIIGSFTRTIFNYNRGLL